MNCWRVQNLVAPFLEGELPEDEHAAIGEHIGRCHACDALVRQVAAVPEFGPPRPPEAALRSLMDAFDGCLHQRLQAKAAAYSDGDFDGRPSRFSLRGDMRLPPALAVAAASMLFLLTGWNLHTHREVADLERAVSERDRVIRTLEQRVVLAEREALPLDELPSRAGSDAVPVFLPASAPQPETALGAAMPVSFQRRSHAPRVVR